jgi:SOS-response transcriptional repressor LexA
MTTDFAKRLKAARTQAGLTQVQLARKAGMGQSTIGELESKGHGSTRTATLAAVCGVTALWLESGEGLMSADAAALQIRLPPGTRRYPVLTARQAGTLARAQGADTQAQDPELGLEVADDGVSPRAFFLQLEGDAMAPEFREGDRVLLDPDRAPQPGDHVAALHAGRQLVFRKYRVLAVARDGSDVFELSPLHPDHPVMRSDEQALTVLATLVEHRRRFRGR